MKHSTTTAIVTFILLLFFHIGNGQGLVFKQSVYFKPGQFKISANNANKLTALIDSFRNYQSYSIELQGNTDNVGNYQANKFLSEKRANAVKAFLVSNGIEGKNITIKALGSDNPIASNKTFAGRQKNRRVEILLWEVNIIKTETAKVIPNISLLFKQLETPLQSFCINRYRDTVIRCKQGTVIYIKANSLLPGTNCDGSCITFNVKEDFLPSDMLFDNLSTTSNGEILESDGMLFTEAVDCNGNKLVLQKGKDLVIVMPTDSINPSAKIFDGNRTHDSIMNWTINNNSILSDFTLSDLDLCGGWICDRVKSTIDCKPCHFFFCRIARVGKAAKGIFSKEQRAINIEFRRCQNELKGLKDSTATILSTNPNVVSTRPALESNLVPKCQELEKLFNQYGVNNLESLLLAINKPLLDSFKVSTITQLKDTLAKITAQKIELSYLNKKVSFSDFKYYVYNSSKLGWTNVDCFAAIPASQKTTLKVNLKAELNIDCKLVFKNSRTIIPATIEEGKYEFKGVPKGKKAFIVAVKYEDGQAFLAMQEVTISNKNFDIEFKELTLEELKAQLRLLD